MKLSRSILIATSVLVSAAASAQSPIIAEAIEAGQVGERYDGYMGFVGTPSPELRRQVLAINIRRRKLYTDLSSRRNVTTALVGMATACQLFTHLAAGEAYMLNDGTWRRQAPGRPAPQPDYCR
jgi:hypothetical protein